MQSTTLAYGLLPAVAYVALLVRSGDAAGRP